MHLETTNNTWDGFNTMFTSVKDGLVELRGMAIERDPTRHQEYVALAKRIVATCRGIKSSTGQCRPPLSNQTSRDRYRKMRAEAQYIERLVRSNSGRWWQGL